MFISYHICEKFPLTCFINLEMVSFFWELSHQIQVCLLLLFSQTRGKWIGDSGFWERMGISWAFSLPLQWLCSLHTTRLSVFWRVCQCLCIFLCLSERKVTNEPIYSFYTNTNISQKQQRQQCKPELLWETLPLQSCLCQGTVLTLNLHLCNQTNP